MQPGSVLVREKWSVLLRGRECALASLKSQLRARRSSALVDVVDEVAARAVWTETNGVKSAAWLCFVLGMAGKITQFVVAMRKLTLLAVLAGAVFLERPAQLGFIASGVDLRARLGLKHFLQLLTTFSCLAKGAVAKLVLLIHVCWCRALLATADGVHVADGVGPEVAARVEPVIVFIGGGERYPYSSPIQHVVQVNCIRALAFLLLKKTII